MKVELRFLGINIFDPTRRFQISAFLLFSLDNRIQACISQNLTNLYHLYHLIRKSYYITIMIIKQFPLLDKTEKILFFDAKYSHARKEC